MRLIDGKIRVMREELKKDTDEIRESYDFGTFVSNFTYHPHNETQNPHYHFCTMEAIHVLAGSVEAGYGNNWRTVNERQSVLFGLGERHNLRTREVTKSLDFPAATANIAAVHMAYKWIPPFLDLDESDTQLLLKSDWWHADCDSLKIYDAA